MPRFDLVSEVGAKNGEDGEFSVFSLVPLLSIPQVRRSPQPLFDDYPHRELLGVIGPGPLKRYCSGT